MLFLSLPARVPVTDEGVETISTPKEIIRMKVLAAVLLSSLALASSALAVDVVSGNPNGNNGTDNVLFNTTDTPGTLVQGTINNAANTLVNFTSSSNDGMLVAPSGGQARIEGAGTNDPFTQLSFMLQSGFGFTNALVNPDATVNGLITFTVQYVIVATNLVYMETLTLNGNGQNFFEISAGAGELITKVSFDTSNSAFVDTAQIRIGGVAAIPQVPEGGAVAAFAVVVASMLAARRKSKQA